MKRRVGQTLMVSLQVLTAAGCGNNPGHYEDVTALRGIGALTTPNVAVPSTATQQNTFAIKFLAALPLGATVETVPYADSEGVVTGVAADLSVDSSTAAYEKHSALQIYSVTANFPVPTIDQLNFIEGLNVATVHYGVQMTASTGTIQYLVGNALVYKPGSTQLTTLVSDTPTITITTPTNNTTVGNSEQTIAASLKQTGSAETFRIGWFTNYGNIDDNTNPNENRNAATTKWNPQGTGPFTLIVTTRGATSGAFAYAVADVTVQ